MHLRRARGYDIKSGKPTEGSYDEIICDGVSIGICFRGQNVIHWRIPKRMIPLSIRKQAVRLLRERNERETSHL